MEDLREPDPVQECASCGKVSHRTKKRAAAEAARYRRSFHEVMDFYKCPQGNGYHLGHPGLRREARWLEVAERMLRQGLTLEYEISRGEARILGQNEDGSVLVVRLDDPYSEDELAGRIARFYETVKRWERAPHGCLEDGRDPQIFGQMVRDLGGDILGEWRASGDNEQAIEFLRLFAAFGQFTEQTLGQPARAAGELPPIRYW